MVECEKRAPGHMRPRAARLANAGVGIETGELGQVLHAPLASGIPGKKQAIDGCLNGMTATAAQHRRTQAEAGGAGGCAEGSGTGHRAVEPCCGGRARLVVVADHRSRPPGPHTLARRLLSRLPDQPRDPHPKARPPPAGVSGKPRAGAAVLVVPRFGADARSYRLIHRAAGCGSEKKHEM